MRLLLFAAILALPLAARAQEQAEQGDEGTEEVEARDEVATAPDIVYTRDISDEDLKRRWTEDLESLGSISVGYADQGRMINAARLPQDGEAWICQRKDLAFGAQETIDSLETVFHAVHEQFPRSEPARLSHIGAREGGYLRPHRSHQSGRDADIGLFWLPRKKLDPARNWALLKAVITLTDVQVVLVDRQIQKTLRDYALKIGEDRDWLDRIFRRGSHSLVQHARRHRDHFHVRFYAPRSQELGRRIQPLLMLRPEQNVAIHVVKKGQTLGHIAIAYSTTVQAIQRANHMHGSFLRLEQRLLIPLRKPCTHCPLPPPVTVPPRCLPPAIQTAQLDR